MGTSSPQRDAEEIEFYASEEDWRNFLASRVWKDFKTYLEVALEDGKELLSLDPEERAFPETDQTLRGGIKMLRRALAFPAERMEELANDRGRDGPDRRDDG